jgi:hypothetical protein
MRGATFWLASASFALGACSTLIGADFEGLRDGSKLSSAGTSGSPNSASGGVAASLGGAASGGSDVDSAGTAGTAGVAAAAGKSGNGSAGAAGLGAVGGNAGAAGAAGNAGSAGAGGGSSKAVVVINEIKGQGSGSDYIELYNLGPGTKALDGHAITDGSNTLKFPVGTTLAEGAFLLILLQQSAQSGGVTCMTPNPCFHDTWGVSSSSGETVSMKGPGGETLDIANYPAVSTPQGLTDGQAWGRLPDGTGSYQAVAVTPEAANTAPGGN